MSTFVKLGSATGGANEIRFSSIPQTYKDLVIIGTLAHNFNPGYAFFTFLCNNDSSSIYDYVQVYHNFTNTDYQFNTSSLRPEVIGTGASSTELSPVFIHIQNYASTTTHKPIHVKAGSVSQAQNFYRLSSFYGVYKSTNAVTQLNLFGSSGIAWNSFSSVNLYALASA